MADTIPIGAEISPEMLRRLHGGSIPAAAPNSIPIGAEIDHATVQRMAGATNPEQPKQDVSWQESAGRGAVQGATFGFGDEVSAGLGALMQKLATDDPETLGEIYRRYRDEERAKNDAAKEAHGGAYLGGQVVGGVVSGLAGGVPASIGKAAAVGGAMGAASGLGGSRADLTRGEFGQAAKDTVVGAVIGTAAGAGGAVIGKGLAKGGEWLKELGRARLFKAAVGQNKRAFTQINGKNLFDKSTQYLDDLGIGAGDTTESIGAKLGSRAESIDNARAAIVGELDAAAPNAISPLDVALRIEKEVAGPLKKIAANQSEYRQAIDAADDIVNIGRDMSFAEAAAQRRAMQEKVKYDVVNNLTASAEVKRKIAKIWNEVIDEKAEPVLRNLGKEGDAYRELRHEYALVEELLGHVNSRIAGNAANRIISPSDYGAGAIAGVMTSNPLAGLAAATANHLGRVYGNAAAGRTAINIGRMAAASPAAMRVLAPSMARAVTPASGNDGEIDQNRPGIRGPQQNYIARQP